MHRRLARASSLALALAVLLAANPWRTAAAPSAAAPWYTITDLGTLGGATSFALDINALGVIAGSAVTVANTTHAYLYRNGVMNDLGTLGGSFGLAAGLNDAGTVTGQADTSAGQRHGFVYRNGVMTDLGTLGGTDSRASDINAAGDIVGNSLPSGTGLAHAFLYHNGVMTDLGMLPGHRSSFANSINATGQIAGGSTPGSGLIQAHAFLYDQQVMTDLGTLGGSRSVAYHIDDAGQVVGWSDMAGDSNTHAFLYRNGVMTDLGALDRSSVATGSTAGGTIVGWSNVVGDSSMHAFVYRCAGMQDLNDLIPAASGWKLVYAAAVNDAGSIVGWGTINGHTHGFLLTLRTPAELLEDLIDLTQSFDLPKGLENSLLVKLQHAERAFAAGDTSGARSAVDAFIHEVNAQSGKALTSDQADQLIRLAQQIQIALACP